MGLNLERYTQNAHRDAQQNLGGKHQRLEIHNEGWGKQKMGYEFVATVWGEKVKVIYMNMVTA